jgi:hypothetical protein
MEGTEGKKKRKERTEGIGRAKRETDGRTGGENPGFFLPFSFKPPPLPSPVQVSKSPIFPNFYQNN